MRRAVLGAIVLSILAAAPAAARLLPGFFALRSVVRRLER